MDYKHGFVLHLKDPLFITEYKRCTKYEHISVNYSRSSSAAVPSLDPGDLEPSDDSPDALCDDLERCPHINRIVSALEEDQPGMDVEGLLLSYDYLVRIHGLFRDTVRRRQILQYFNSVIGFCRQTKDCPIYTAHYERTLESSANIQSDAFLDRRYHLTADVNQDLMQNTLIVFTALLPVSPLSSCSVFLS